MPPVRVVESVDIDAPRAELWAILADNSRRLRLSPLWGVAEIQDVDPNYPQEGSRYHVKLIGDEPVEYDNVVTEFVPPHKFAYRVTAERQTHTTWTLQEVSQGTRLMFNEEFLVDDTGEDDFVHQVRAASKEWLQNIKRYAELRHNWRQRLVRRAIDRFVLPLKASQRRVILILLAWEAVGCLAFVGVALVWGAASLFRAN
jgi:hypothetical protein